MTDSVVGRGKSCSVIDCQASSLDLLPLAPLLGPARTLDALTSVILLPNRWMTDTWSGGRDATTFHAVGREWNNGCLCHWASFQRQRALESSAAFASGKSLDVDVPARRVRSEPS